MPRSGSSPLEQRRPHKARRNRRRLGTQTSRPWAAAPDPARSGCQEAARPRCSPQPPDAAGLDTAGPSQAPSSGRKRGCPALTQWRRCNAREQNDAASHMEGLSPPLARHLSGLFRPGGARAARPSPTFEEEEDNDERSLSRSVGAVEPGRPFPQTAPREGLTPRRPPAARAEESEAIGPAARIASIATRASCSSATMWARVMSSTAASS